MREVEAGDLGRRRSGHGAREASRHARRRGLVRGMLLRCLRGSRARTGSCCWVSRARVSDVSKSAYQELPGWRSGREVRPWCQKRSRNRDTNGELVANTSKVMRRESVTAVGLAAQWWVSCCDLDQRGREKKESRLVRPTELTRLARALSFTSRRRGKCTQTHHQG